LHLICQKKLQYKVVYQAQLVIDKFSGKFLIAMFSSGLIFLYERFSRVGISETSLSDVRDIFNEEAPSIFARIATHISFIMTAVLTFSGIKRWIYKIEIKNLIKVIACGAPIGLANGGRGFLLGYLIAYLSSFVITRAKISKSITIFTKKEAVSLFLLKFILLLIFSILGFLRGGYDEYDFLYTVLIWPVSTISFMESWITSTLSGESTHGLYTFLLFY